MITGTSTTVHELRQQGHRPPYPGTATAEPPQFSALKKKRSTCRWTQRACQRPCPKNTTRCPHTDSTRTAGPKVGTKLNKNNANLLDPSWCGGCGTDVYLNSGEFVLTTARLQFNYGPSALCLCTGSKKIYLNDSSAREWTACNSREIHVHPLEASTNREPPLQ